MCKSFCLGRRPRSKIEQTGSRAAIVRSSSASGFHVCVAVWYKSHLLQRLEASRPGSLDRTKHHSTSRRFDRDLISTEPFVTMILEFRWGMMSGALECCEKNQPRCRQQWQEIGDVDHLDQEERRVLVVSTPSGEPSRPRHDDSCNSSLRCLLSAVIARSRDLVLLAIVNHIEGFCLLCDGQTVTCAFITSIGNRLIVVVRFLTLQRPCGNWTLNLAHVGSVGNGFGPDLGIKFVVVDTCIPASSYLCNIVLLWREDEQDIKIRAVGLFSVKTLQLSKL